LIQNEQDLRLARQQKLVRNCRPHSGIKSILFPPGSWNQTLNNAIGLPSVQEADHVVRVSVLDLDNAVRFSWQT